MLGPGKRSDFPDTTYPYHTDDGNYYSFKTHDLPRGATNYRPIHHDLNFVSVERAIACLLQHHVSGGLQAKIQLCQRGDKKSQAIKSRAKGTEV
eukprot:1185790-Karenia_brevis.AAC.1